MYLKISEFARRSGIARKNLIFYDEIGLLKPARVLDNGYRYYDIRQLDSASVISALREIGMALSEIQAYLDGRTPQVCVELFTEQKRVLSAKMERLRRIEAMLDTRIDLTRRALEGELSSIEVCECPAEPLFVSEQVDCTNAETAELSAYAFYDFCDSKGLTYGYPLGDIIPREALEKKGVLWPARYFFKYPPVECCASNAVKPAGLYLVTREQSYYDVPRSGYARLFEYMRTYGYEIAGDAYEEFLLDEIAVKSPDSFVLQISIQVRPCT